jgi:hypothetical protein
MRWLCLFLLCALPAFISAEPDIRIISGIVEEEEALVGQRRTFFIEIQTDTWFSGPIEITPPAMDGVILAQLEAFGVNGTIRQDGTTFTTHRKEFTLFALNPGSVVIPPGQVRAQIADPGNPPIAYSGESPEVVFEAVMPDGVQWEGPLLTTRALTLRESWDHEPGPGMVGDAFQRTISIEADGILGMVFPPFPAPDMDGVRIYRDAPRVEDKTGRGGLTGLRSETLTYVFEKPGQVTLPAYSLSWWDVGTSTLKEAQLSAHRFEIAPLPGAEVEPGKPGGLPGEDSDRPGSSWLWAVLAVVLLATIVFLFRSRLHASDDTESKLFSALLEAIPSGDAPAVYRAWRVWSIRCLGVPVETSPPLLEMEKAAMGYADDFDRPAFRAWILQLRDQQTETRTVHGTTVLPDLNP